MTYFKHALILIKLSHVPISHVPVSPNCGIKVLRDKKKTKQDEIRIF